MSAKEKLKARCSSCLRGALAGDCIGARFESVWADYIPSKDVEEWIDAATSSSPTLSDGTGTSKRSAGVLKYTDDTAMLRPLHEHLTKNHGRVVGRELAQEFVQGYFRQPNRGYGRSVTKIFEALRDGFAMEDVPGTYNYLHPAASSFHGKGSFGNGASMRAAPCAILNSDSWDDARLAAENQARITHANPDGILGAVVLTRAVWQALQLPSGFGERERLFFVPNISSALAKDSAHADNWLASLGELLELRERWEASSSSYPSVDEEAKEIAKKLGHDVSALRSVPTAIYSFLRAHQLNQGVRGAISFACAVGGDTDTIASMAGAIAGAAGLDFPQQLWRNCEGNELPMYNDK